MISRQKQAFQNERQELAQNDTEEAVELPKEYFQSKNKRQGKRVSLLSKEDDS